MAHMLMGNSSRTKPQWSRRRSSADQFRFLEFERIPHDGSSREVHKVFTEEEDADENGWIAVILWIIHHHCVTKIIGFDVSYGYVCSYGYSATTAIFNK